MRHFGEASTILAVLRNIGVFGHRHLEYKFGTVPAIKVQSLHVMASTIPERIHCFLLWGDKYTLRRDSSIHRLSSSQTDLRISSFYYRAQSH